MANFWYSYTGVNTPTSAYLIPSNYVLSTTPTLILCPSPQDRPCLLYANSNGALPSKPIITTLLRQYIINGFINSSNQPTIPALAKIYLYVRRRLI